MLEPAATRPEPPDRWYVRIFASSWLSYFSYYFTRKNFSVAKKSFGAELGFDKRALGNIDTALLIAYAVGQVGNGILADKFGPRRTVAVGMLVSASASFAFGVADRMYGAVLAVYVLIWGINGLVQSSGWPGNGKLMASWFSTTNRGVVMGWWSTCYQAGGLVSGLVASWLLGFGWRTTFVGPALWVAVVGVAFALLVRDRPSQLGFADPEIPVGMDAAMLRRLRKEAQPRILRNPMTWSLGVAYFCLKMMRYSFLFWLPYYLATALRYQDQQAGYMAQAFEAGGIPFVVVSGILADRVFGKRRIAVAAASMVLLCGALFLYRSVGDQGVAPNVLSMMLVGAFLFGADALVSGAAAQDLGGPHAAALACGLINGIGSIGGAVQTYVTVYVSDAYGWNALFSVFMGLSLVGALALRPYARVKPAA
jgi:OPA family sugar phosphate sensor protein UhpC-like MFS transporter